MGALTSRGTLRETIRQDLGCERADLKEICRHARLQTSVAIIAQNEEDTIADCIRSVLRQTRPAEEIIVVDDHSVDRTVDIANCLQAKTISSMGHGAGAARKTATLTAKSSLTAFLDADCIADDKWLEEAERHLVKTGAAACTGPILPHQPRSNRELSRTLVFASQARVLGRGARPIGFSELPGGNSVIRRDLLIEIGNFDENLYRDEDDDVGRRLKLAGHAITYCPDAIVYHRHDKKLRHRNRNKRLYYQLIGARTYFRKWHAFDGFQALHALRSHPHLLARVFLCAFMSALREGRFIAFLWAVALWTMEISLEFIMVMIILLLTLTESNRTSRRAGTVRSEDSVLR